MFHVTASFKVVSLFLLITKLFLLPAELLAFTRHPLCLFTPFLKEATSKISSFLTNVFWFRSHRDTRVTLTTCKEHIAVHWSWPCVEIDTAPALYGLSLSQSSPSPNAPFPVFVSPSQASVAPGEGSLVLHAPDAHVQPFPVALIKLKHSRFYLHCSKNKKVLYIYNLFNVCELHSRLPAPLHSSTDPLHTSHPFACSLLLHLLKGQNLFTLVRKRVRLVFHHPHLEVGVDTPIQR